MKAEVVDLKAAQAPPTPPLAVGDCICAPPVQHLTQRATDICHQTNGRDAILPWDVAMTLALFGVVIARSVAERKHYEGYLSGTHMQCPKHEVVFWPRVGDQPEGSG